MTPDTTSSDAAVGGTREVLAFSVGADDYCVGIQSVREIRGWIPTTPIPHTPDFVRGVVNLRGTVLPILDLSARLAGPPAEASARHAIIVTEAAGQVIGMLVDGVNGILSIRDRDIHPAPDVGTAPVASFMEGLIISGDRMISMLSLEKVVPRNMMA